MQWWCSWSWGSSSLLALFAFMPIRIPEFASLGPVLRLLGFWGNTGFAWQDFGAFIVKKTGGKASTVQLRVLRPADVGRDRGIAGWFSDNSIAKIDIAAYVPLMQKTVAEGERIARWIDFLARESGRPAARIAHLAPARRRGDVSGEARQKAGFRRRPEPTIAKVTADRRWCGGDRRQVGVDAQTHEAVRIDPASPRRFRIQRDRAGLMRSDSDIEVLPHRAQA